jgi:hypothetical protein
MLHNWESLGYEKANQKFKKLGLDEDGDISSTILRFSQGPQLKKVLDGKLNYLRMVKGMDNSTYQALLNRFKKLNPKKAKVTEKQARITSNSNRKDHIQQTIDLLINEGIDKAMSFYQPV